ncbi:MAG: hypothetical protein LBV18_03935 [Alistipes sp.]|nr:hypothetical protein [Alistipes sp.]
MNFTTPCSVSVEDRKEQEKLFEWLKSIGYSVNSLGGRWHFTYTHGDGIIHSHWCADGIKGIRKIKHCGTDIDLFKALAAMNDDNDRKQWFININTGEWALSEHDDLGLTKLIWDKATTEEIIEHFKNIKQ